MVLIELYLGGLGLWGDSIRELGSGEVFLSLVLQNVFEDRLARYVELGDLSPESERKAGLITMA